MGIRLRDDRETVTMNRERVIIENALTHRYTF